MATSIVDLKPAHFHSIDDDILDVHGRTIGPIGYAIYGYLCRRRNRKTGQCTPSIGRIADAFALARSTVKEYLHILRDAGLIAMAPRVDPAGDPTSNSYTLLDPSPVATQQRVAALAAEKAAGAREGGGLSADPPVPEGGRPPADLPPAATHPTGRPPADPEPSSSLEPPEKNQDTPARAEGPGRETPKEPEPPERPDDVLSRLDAPTVASLHTAALTLLETEGVHPLWQITPVVQSYMVRLWYQQQAVLREGGMIGAGSLAGEEGQAHATYAA